MSVMKDSMTKDNNFRVSWLSHNLGQHHACEKFLSMYIMRSVLTELTIDF
jgi:hypothetical protein